MKLFSQVLLLVAAMAALRLYATDSERWPVRDQATTTKSFNISAQPMRVVLDNVEGYVHVSGTNGNQVKMTIHKTIRAETDADLEKARHDVDLQLTADAGTVTAYYAAPWRCEHGNCSEEHRHFYSVAYDLDVEVPREARLVASTVNRGDVRVDGTNGSFDVSGVNGGISMSAIGGSGKARTVNGPVSVRFTRNPTQASTFKTINGAVDVYLQPNLSADLAFKTFNGQVYSDFDVTTRANVSTPETRGDGKFVYHSHGMTVARAGNGGPELSFDSLNGDIRLHLSK